MPFALIVIAVILMISAYRDTQDELFNIIKDVFDASTGFKYWILASIILGFLASINEIKKPVNMFIILMMVVLVLRQKGLYQKTIGSIKK